MKVIVHSKYVKIVVIAINLFLVIGTEVKAQIRTEGIPQSQTRSLQEEVTTRQLLGINVEQLLDEDALESLSDTPVPPRFGYAYEVKYGLANSGSWSELEDGQVWRLRLESPGALSINLIFSEFFMPDSATLFVYNDDCSEVLGAYTSRNNKPYGKFSIQPISGSAVTLEYFEPKAVQGQGKLTLSHVIHGYKPFLHRNEVKGKFGDSGSCNVNINCSQGSAWQDEKHAVAMIILDDGTRWCTGSLVNNEEEDYTPYFLTAFHCGDDPYYPDGSLSTSELNDIESWIFMFNYESPTCSNIDGPTYQTISGATLRS